MIVPHYEALKARLSEHPVIGANVFDVARTGENGLIRANYLLLFLERVTLDDERLSAISNPDSDTDFIATVRAVGTTPAAVMAWTDYATVQLQGHRLAVEGRDCVLLSEGTDATRPDTATSPPLYYAATDYALRSSRA